jgi:hypothetical protein
MQRRPPLPWSRPVTLGCDWMIASYAMSVGIRPAGQPEPLKGELCAGIVPWAIITLQRVGREALLLLTLVCASVFSTRPSIAGLALLTVVIVSLASLRGGRSHIASDDGRKPAA